MLPSLFVHTVTIKREVKGDQNSLGEKGETLTTIYTDIPARVEFERQKVEYNPSGQRSVNRTIVYLKPEYSNLQDQDQVFRTDTGTDVFIGLTRVVEALSPQGKPLDHFELEIENP